MGRALSLAILAVASWAGAHADPSDDVHPTVVVENGKFEVYFSNHLVPMREEHPSFRMIFDPDGTVMVPRHSAEKEVPRAWPAQYGKTEKEDRRGRYRVDAEALHLEITSKEDRETMIPSPWKNDASAIATLQDFEPADRLYLLGMLGEKLYPLHPPFDVVAFCSGDV